MSIICCAPAAQFLGTSSQKQDVATRKITVVENTRCCAAAALLELPPASPPGLTRGSIRFVGTSCEEDGCAELGLARVPVLSGASRVYPTCGVKPAHDGLHHREPAVPV